ncbi:MAG: hypothetical protein H0V44_01040 [Planctomycetes bacterium]|nr:hypothetical protein [Planctomycetota bacterium]
MRLLSGIIRIVSGVIVMALAAYVHLTAQDEIADGKTKAFLFGHEVDLPPEMLLNVVLAVGAIGALVVVYGVVTLVRGARRSATAGGAPSGS